MILNKNLLILVAIFMIIGCRPSVEKSIKIETQPLLVPDYCDVTIPKNIAPLNFSIIDTDSLQWIEAKIVTNNQQEYIFSGKKFINFPIDKWQEILEKQAGKDFSVTVKTIKNNIEYTYAPFNIKVADCEIDNYLCYRLIEPVYELYSRMGIYCRNLTNFEQTTVVDNRLLNANCVNCHSFCKGNTDLAQFHIRGTLGCSVVKKGDKISICNTKTENLKLNCVYPYWHPLGKYIAYSQNNTAQAFHCGSANRIEVYDQKSRVVVYNCQTNKLITSPKLNNENTFTTEPSFSPDGQYLYYTTSKACDMEESTQNARYDICRITFNTQNETFGKVDTLVKVSQDSLTTAFPRPSYDGKYLLYTKFSYGQFGIWHKEADLWMLDLEKDTTFPLQKANSNDADSYHSWSQNSRWIAFESRRDDGLYTRVYIAYINDDGTAEKAFLLPQYNPEDNLNLMYSYNVPEFAISEFSINKAELENKVKKGEKIQFTD